MSPVEESPRPLGFRSLLRAVKDTVSLGQLADDLGAELGPESAGGERRGYGVCHAGENPTALSVDTEQQVYYCHRCGEGGDHLDLWECVYGYDDRKHALIALAGAYGAFEHPSLGRPQSWHKWQSEKHRRRNMIRAELARSYQRRYFRLFSGHLEAIEDGDEREREGKRFWDDLWPVCLASAEWRLSR